MMEQILTFLTTYWAVLTTVGIIGISVIGFIWRIHIRARLNERMIAAHKEDDRDIHEAMMRHVERTERSIDLLSQRFDEVMARVHETTESVNAGLSAQHTTIRLLKNRVDRMSGAIADIKISLQKDD